MATLPKKLLSRKDEITAGFFRLMEQHIDDLLHNRVDELYHAKQFAALLFIHPRHLSNTIKLTTGRSPCDFMEERITAETQKLLLETDLSIAEVAARFAYFEPTNFIKFFKGMTGITPLQYRKAHRQLLKKAA